MKPLYTLIFAALAAVPGMRAQAQNLVTITPTAAAAATVTPRWAIGGSLSGLAYDDSNSGFPGATATNFFTITGAAVPGSGSPSGFISYLPSGTASPQASVGNALTPNSYSGLAYVAENLGLIGPLSFYSIHHGAAGDYLALIQPAVPTVSDQKPMSVSGGPLTPGGTGYFTLAYAADSPGGWGAQLFYYLRTNSLGETVFGSLIPALLSGPTDRWNLGAGHGFTDLAYTSTDLGFGFGAGKFYYLRLDPLTQTTFFGWIDPLTGTATDIQNLGGVYHTLTFTPTDVGYGPGNFYSISWSAQAITFASIPGHTACDAPFTLAPTASSGLPVTLIVTSGPATISGATVTLTGTGSVTLQATQPGDGTYASASAVSQTFAVAACPAAPTSQAITFAPIPSHTACDASFPLAPTASSGLPVTLVVTSGPATVSGSNVVTLTGAVGTVVLTAAQAGNSTFAAAANVIQSFTVGACPAAPTFQAITFAAVPDQGLCGGPFTVNPTASSGLPVTLVVTNGPATVSGDTVTLTGPGNVTLRASQAGNGTYASASPVSRTFAAAKCVALVSLGTLTTGYHQAPFNPLYWTVTTVPAGLNTVETFNGSTTPPVGAGTYAVVATVVDPDYTGTATATLVLSPDLRAAQTVSFGVPLIPNHVFGDPPFTLNPTASSGMATVLAVASGPATVSGNTVTLTGVGTVVLEVSQAGDIQYYTFAYLSQSFVVTKAPAAITLTNLTQNYDGTPKSALVATIPAGLNTDLTYNGSSTAPSAAGSYAVQATVNDSDYQGSAEGTLLLSLPPQVITFSQTAVFSNAAPFALQASSSSHLPITFTLLSGPASLTGSTVTLTGAPGIVTVRASQAGNSDYLAAPTVIVAFDVSLAAPLTNVSLFGPVDPVQNAIVAGFVIAGAGTKPILLRGVGPSLAGYGVIDALSAPMLQLYDGSGSLLLTASSWNGSSLASLFTALGAFPLAAGGGDAAASTILSPGNYTLVVGGVSGATGMALAEVYDASPTPLLQTVAVINVSSLGQVSPGSPITAGFVIGGSTPAQVLIRGVGPSLGSFGVTGALSDPFLRVADGNGKLVAQNDNWGTALTVNDFYPGTSAAVISAAAAAAGAFQLGIGSHDSAVLVTLPPGPYSAQVSAVGAAAGTTLLEVYEVP